MSYNISVLCDDDDCDVTFDDGATSLAMSDNDCSKHGWDVRVGGIHFCPSCAYLRQTDRDK